MNIEEYQTHAAADLALKIIEPLDCCGFGGRLLMTDEKHGGKQQIVLGVKTCIVAQSTGAGHYSR
jgi:hypothetical protein